VDVSSAVQVLPALAVHEPAAEFGADARRWGRAAARMRARERGGVRTALLAAARSAARSAVTQPAASRSSAGACVLAMTDELLAGGPELMTFLVRGRAAGLGELAVERVRAVSPETEVECPRGRRDWRVVLAGRSRRRWRRCVTRCACRRGKAAKRLDEAFGISDGGDLLPLPAPDMPDAASCPT